MKLKGALRYGKGVVSSVAIAMLAFGAKYSVSWLFPSVDDPDPPGIVLLDEFSQATHSLSPQRSVAQPDTARWKIAVVTNRLLDTPREGRIQGVSHRASDKSLAEQAVDLQFATTDSTYGIADVLLPLNRRRGRCDLQKDAAAKVTVGHLTSLSKDLFANTVEELMRNAKAKDVLIFVHGFNVTLEESIARAAQISEDMPFHGVIVAFSWQSAARTDAYLTDEKVAERYFWNLAEVLANLRRRLDEKVNLHLLAHSMGNRVALRALNALSGSIDPAGRTVDPIGLAQLPIVGARRSTSFPSDHHDLASLSSPSYWRSVVSLSPAGIRERFPDWASWRSRDLERPPLDTLILAAPDVNAEEFRGFVRNVRHVSRTSVLYASDTDYALEASRKVHGGDYRAGDSRANIQLDGLHVVRVSGVNSVDPLGHSYYGSHPKVLDQLARLLRPDIDLTQPISRLARIGNEAGGTD